MVSRPGMFLIYINTARMLFEKGERLSSGVMGGNALIEQNFSALAHAHQWIEAV
jgi:hypothetical protein